MINLRNQFLVLAIVGVSSTYAVSTKAQVQSMGSNSQSLTIQPSPTVMRLELRIKELEKKLEIQSRENGTLKTQIASNMSIIRKKDEEIKKLNREIQLLQGLSQNQNFDRRLLSQLKSFQLHCSDPQTQMLNVYTNSSRQLLNLRAAVLKQFFITLPVENLPHPFQSELNILKEIEMVTRKSCEVHALPVNPPAGFAPEVNSSNRN